MQAQLTQNNWQQPLNPQYWFKHLLLPAILIIGFLLLPKPWATQLFNTNQVIEIELFNADPVQPQLEKTPEPVKQEPIIEPILKPVEKPEDPPIVQPIEDPIKEPIEQPSEAAKQPTTTIQAIEQPPKIQINAGDVMNMIENRTPIDIPTEFQARTGPTKDFYIPEQEIKNWLDDIPFLDESIDRPKIQMKFYAEGIDGVMEKFFDKITISKTFTTKYGTKVHCALIGVLAACSWK